MFEYPSEWNIWVFLGFTNFYCLFIPKFNQIAIPLTSILTTLKSWVFTIILFNNKGIVDSDNKFNGNKLNKDKKSKFINRKN